MPKYLVTYSQRKRLVVDAPNPEAAEEQIVRGHDEEGNEPDYAMEEYLSVEVEEVEETE